MGDDDEWIDDPTHVEEPHLPVIPDAPAADEAAAEFVTDETTAPRDLALLAAQERGRRAGRLEGMAIAADAALLYSEGQDSILSGIRQLHAEGREWETIEDFIAELRRRAPPL